MVHGNQNAGDHKLQDGVLMKLPAGWWKREKTLYTRTRKAKQTVLERNRAGGGSASACRT